MIRSILLIVIMLGLLSISFAQAPSSDEKSEAILKKAVQLVGGEKYLQARSQVGRGSYTVIRDGAVISYQSFIDALVYPDKERTEFKSAGVKTVQTNIGSTGWTFDGNNEIIKIQDEAQVANFKRGLRVSLDNLLRGYWRSDGVLTYAGRRQAGLGKRNDVLKLTFKDGLVVEFEFADDGFPAKSVYKRTSADNEDVKEEDRYAQFIDVDGIKTPFIIDRFSNDKQSSRINYESIEFNRSIPDSVFTKPSSAKELKKDLKL